MVLHPQPEVTKEAESDRANGGESIGTVDQTQVVSGFIPKKYFLEKGRKGKD
jgi:hypothetical protein